MDEERFSVEHPPVPAFFFIVLALSMLRSYTVCQAAAALVTGRAPWDNGRDASIPVP